MKVAIIHYWFITRRGGEKVVESLLKIYPESDIYTLFYDKEQYGCFLNNHQVFVSKYNTPFFRKHYQKIFPLYPNAIKSLKLQDNYDLIISSESGPAKGIEIKDNTPHVCYIHSPMRYCWSHTEMYVESANPILRPFMRFFFKQLREWDKKTINNVDLYIANSKNVANRVKEYYNREAIVVHPPIEEHLFQKPLKESKKEVYLSFGAITPYKKIDLLVDTFNKNGKKLIIIGKGSEKEKLVQKAKSNIQFKVYPDWKDIEETFSKTKALLFPGEEDFGMIPLEVMSYGIPVIAYKKGGALETVVENRGAIAKSSGLFFERQTTKSLQKTLDLFEEIENDFNPSFIRNHAEKFKESEFIKKMKQQINTFLNKNNE